MAIIVDDVFEVNVEFENGSERGMNVLHYKVSNVIESDEAPFIEALIAQLVLDIDATVQLYSGEGTTMICVTARRVKPGGATRVYTAFGDGVPSPREKMGGAQLSMLLSKYALAGEEPFSGRTYFPFPSEELGDDGQIYTDQKTGILSQFGKWLSDPIVLSSIGTVLPALYRGLTGEPIVSSLIDNLVLRPVLASQNRRVKHHQNFIPTPP